MTSNDETFLVSTMAIICPPLTSTIRDIPNSYFFFHTSVPFFSSVSLNLPEKPSFAFIFLVQTNPPLPLPLPLPLPPTRPTTPLYYLFHLPPPPSSIFNHASIVISFASPSNLTLLSDPTFLSAADSPLPAVVSAPPFCAWP